VTLIWNKTKDTFSDDDREDINEVNLAGIFIR